MQIVDWDAIFQILGLSNGKVSILYLAVEDVTNRKCDQTLLYLDVIYKQKNPIITILSVTSITNIHHKCHPFFDHKKKSETER